MLGVDDWALRKGHSYGTILIDLEHHQVVDLLPERSADSLAKWLKDHPGVCIISRDRGTQYIKGATDGAPGAIQVADRWHLLKNLTETMQQLLEHKPACLKAAAQTSAAEPRPPTQPENQNSTSTKEPIGDATQSIVSSSQPTQREKELTKTEKQKRARRAMGEERHEKVRQLYQLGLSKSEIARRLNINWRTVSKYVQSETCPMYPIGVKRKSKLNSHIDYLNHRWQEGCHNASLLHREIVACGFSGSYRTVGQWAVQKRQSTSFETSDSLEENAVPWSARRGAWVLVKPEEELEIDELQALERIKATDDKVACAHTLGQRFGQMIREKKPDELPGWLSDVANSGVEKLKGFAICTVATQSPSILRSISYAIRNTQDAIWSTIGRFEILEIPNAITRGHATSRF